VALLKEMQDNGLLPTIAIYNMHLDSSCEPGRLNDSKEFFIGFKSKGLQLDCTMYTIMIKGLCKKGLISEAGELLSTMEDKGYFPVLAPVTQLLEDLYSIMI